MTNGPDGMELSAGPEWLNDAHHMVLWTKESFEGDLKIEYDYVHLDSETRGVNILYIQATGYGEPPYSKDIAEWNDLRTVPAIRMYYDYMNTYHISYAAFDSSANEYMRARRYMPNADGLDGTGLLPDYAPAGLYETGVPHRIVVIKRDRDLFMRVGNEERVLDFHWTNPSLPLVSEGRIGLRLMFTRSSRFKNIRISRLRHPLTVDNADGAENVEPGVARLRGTLSKGPADVRIFWGVADGGTNTASWARTNLLTEVATGAFHSDVSNLLHGLGFDYGTLSSASGYDLRFYRARAWLH